MKPAPGVRRHRSAGQPVSRSAGQPASRPAGQGQPVRVSRATDTDQQDEVSWSDSSAYTSADEDATVDDVDRPGHQVVDGGTGSDSGAEV